MLLRQAGTFLTLLTAFALCLPVAAQQPPADPYDPSQLKLEQFKEIYENQTITALPGIEDLKLGDLGTGDTPIGEIPGLKDLTLGQIPGFDPTEYGIPADGTSGICRNGICPTADWEDMTIEEAIDAGYLPEDLLTEPVSALPGLSEVTLGQIPGIDSVNLDQIPGLGSTLLSNIPLDCFFPQLTDHVNTDYGGFTEFATPPQRFKVGQEKTCGNIKIRHSRVDEAKGQGYFELYVWTPCGPGCYFWAGPFPWQTAIEESGGGNGWWLGPMGGYTTTDTKGGTVAPPPPPPKGKPAPVEKPKPVPTAGTKTQRIAATAKDQLNKFCTRNIEGTKNGRLGCAAAVNGIVQIATGKQVGGGLSTALMDAAMRNGSGTAISSSQAVAGDIVISPTVGDNTGHVGFCLSNGCTVIGSNSSNVGCYKQNFTLSSWLSYYQSKKGLAVKFYRVK
ncbi:hypothetical protein [Gloeobacter morelensis]|uniref:hypothetical protein n=1 Tax=Gloeobacter morelensis TaxID=2907343 RepID=UPI001E395CC8|nr:hypothetical protein [Gloeobacter morelensis]UFP97216.1 hypothetical protein ISF26_24145 [Gloeobacter morelensis MG652769]